MGVPVAGPGVVLIEVIGSIPAESGVGAPVVRGPLQTVAPDGIAPSVSVGSPAVVPTGSVAVFPPSIQSVAVVGEPTIAPGPVSVSPTGIPPASAVGSPLILRGQVPYSVPFTI